MLEGYSAQQPLAIWNDARGAWEMPTANLFCAHLELFSATWPAAGMMRDGQVFELPTQAHRTTVSESSFLPTPNTLEHLPAREGEARERQLRRGGEESRRALSGNLREDILTLMPTPNTMDHLPARSAEAKAANKGKGGYSNVRETVVNDLLPTTTASDWKGANHSGSDSASANGIATTVELLPTPTVSDNTGAAASEVATDNPHDRLKVAVKLTNWGKFEPAIRRWEEVIGRPAPAPTKPNGKDGAHRLSSAFTEWMMGLPEGWITDCGLTRNEELKTCGNGVVPQQAELALRMLFDTIKEQQ